MRVSCRATLGVASTPGSRPGEAGKACTALACGGAALLIMGTITFAPAPEGAPTGAVTAGVEGVARGSGMAAVSCRVAALTLVAGPGTSTTSSIGSTAPIAPTITTSIAGASRPGPEAALPAPPRIPGRLVARGVGPMGQGSAAVRVIVTRKAQEVRLAPSAIMRGASTAEIVQVPKLASIGIGLGCMCVKIEMRTKDRMGSRDKGVALSSVSRTIYTWQYSGRAPRVEMRSRAERVAEVGK